MRAIPKQFQMGPHTITVRIVSKAEMAAQCKRNGHPPSTLGYTIFDTNEIFVLRASPSFPKRMQEHTFWHEYFHMLMERASRPRLARDENLVDTLGGLQLQAFNTARY